MGTLINRNEPAYNVDNGNVISPKKKRKEIIIQLNQWNIETNRNENQMHYMYYPL